MSNNKAHNKASDWKSRIENISPSLKVSEEIMDDEFMTVITLWVSQPQKEWWMEEGETEMVNVAHVSVTLFKARGYSKEETKTTISMISKEGKFEDVRHKEFLSDLRIRNEVYAA